MRLSAGVPLAGRSGEGPADHHVAADEPRKVHGQDTGAELIHSTIPHFLSVPTSMHT